MIIAKSFCFMPSMIFRTLPSPCRAERATSVADMLAELSSIIICRSFTPDVPLILGPASASIAKRTARSCKYKSKFLRSH